MKICTIILIGLCSFFICSAQTRNSRYDSLSNLLLARQKVYNDSIYMQLNYIKFTQKEIINKPTSNDDLSKILTAIISALAILMTYFGVYRQIRSNEKNHLNIQKREWCYQLINYVSEYINEIENHKTIFASTILSGNPVSDRQAILELKIDLLLSNSTSNEKNLLKKIIEYKANRMPANNQFKMQEWLRNIVKETHNVINSKWI